MTYALEMRRYLSKVNYIIRYSMYTHTDGQTCIPTILLCSITPSMLRVRSVPNTTVTDLSDSDVDGEIASCVNEYQ